MAPAPLVSKRMCGWRAATSSKSGPICTPGDTLYWGARLPELAAGDSVVIMDAGAYFVPFSTAFSFSRPAIVAVDGGEVKLLRRAETFEDLLALDQMQS